MSNTGYLAPVSAFTVSGGFGGTRPWVSAGSTGTLASAVRLSDNLRVMIDDISAAVIPFPLIAQFSPAIPAGSEVQGFSVRYERRRNTAGVSANETWMMLTSGAGAGFQRLGTTANSNTGNWTTTDTYVTAGGSGSMFGIATADASAGRVNSKFGVAINIRYGTGTTLTSAIAQIDNVQLQIHYTPPTTNAEIFSAEFDREAFSVAIRPNVIGQSAEYGLEIGSMGVSALALVGTQSAEFGYEAGQIDLEEIAGAVGADVKTAEFDYESASLAVSLNVAAQSTETGFESDSALLTSLSNIAAQSAETGFESGDVVLAANIVPDSQEFDTEAGTVALTQLHVLGIEGAEYDHETTSALIGLGVSPSESEFDSEIGSAALVLNVAAQEFEADYESGSVLIALPGLAIDEVSTGYEVGDVSLVKNLTADRAEFEFEVRSIFLTGGEVNPLAAEFDLSWGSPYVSVPAVGGYVPWYVRRRSLRGYARRRDNQRRRWA